MTKPDAEVAAEPTEPLAHGKRERRSPRSGRSRSARSPATRRPRGADAPRRATDFKVDGLLAKESHGQQQVRREIMRVVGFLLFALAAALYQILTSK